MSTIVSGRYVREIMLSPNFDFITSVTKVGALLLYFPDVQN